MNIAVSYSLGEISLPCSRPMDLGVQLLCLQCGLADTTTIVQFMDTARKEIAALILSDEHPNVVRVFAMEEDQEFVYLALECCDRSLAQLLHHSDGTSEFYDSRGKPTDFCMQVCDPALTVHLLLRS